MKKKISLLGLILILVLSFTGCGKSETTEYDQVTLEQYAEFVVQNFEAMTTEQLDSFSDMRDLQLDTQLMNVGLPVDGEDFLTMISSWEAAEEECGAYVEHGDWTMEVKNDGVSLTSEAKYENRDADIVFSFDEKGNMESMDVSAHYSTGEILEKAGLNTVLGMGTVFVVLIFISFIIYLLGYIPKLQEKLANKDKKVEEKKEAPVQAAPAPVAAAEDDAELVAVIAAAIPEKDPIKCVEAGLAQNPKTSRLYEAILDTIEITKKYTAIEDIQEAIWRLFGKYNWVHTIPNAAMCTAAFLWSEGDFEKGITAAVSGGFDTDCNGATVGSMVGAMNGAQGIPDSWKAPLNDTMYSFVPGFHPIAISECARRTASAAKKIRG